MNRKQRKERERHHALQKELVKERERENRTRRLEQAWNQAWLDLLDEQDRFCDKMQKDWSRVWIDLQKEQSAYCEAYRIKMADVPQHEDVGSW